MFAVNCPYCQHVNKRGARYCADCGAALHLKPCAKCGKVDDVTATQCVNCGTVFPTIELADYRLDGEPPSAASKVAADDVGEVSRPTLRAGPLIIIAVVAGGLPFLWMNRERLPQPGELQMRAGGGLAISAPPTAVTVEPRSGVQVSAPVSAAEVKAVESSVAAQPAEAPAVKASPVSPPAREEPRAVSPKLEPQTEAMKAAPRQEKKPERAAVELRQPTPPPARQRECTESLRALGLCETK